jgi:hypothetical protein
VSLTYKRGTVPSRVVDVPQYLDREQQKLEKSFLEPQDYNYHRVMKSALSKPRAGMMIYADGSNWNPGAGPGIYVRNESNTEWVYVSHYVNVKLLGARGNGSTDDTSAIQDAIDMVSGSGGGKVWFPEGTYQLSSELDIPSDVGLHGAGLDSTVLRMATTASATEIVKTAPTSATLGSRNIVMQDMTLRGNSNTGVAVQMDALYRSTFERIRVQSITAAGAWAFKLQTWQDGADWRPSSRNSFRDCIALDAPGSMQFTKASGDPNSHGGGFNLVERCHFAGYTDKGVFVEHGEGNTFIGTSATASDDNTIGYYVNDTVTTFIGCHADSTAGAALAATVDDWGFPTGVLDNSNIGWYFTDSAMGGSVINPLGNGCRKRVDFENWTAFYATFVDRHQYHWGGNWRAGGFHSHVLTIEDDTAKLVELGATVRHGRCDVIAKDTTLSIRGGFFYRSVTGHAIQAAADATGFTVAAAGTTLSGTTGVDGAFTVSSAGSGLYFENRTGASKTVLVNIISDNAA